MSSGLVVDQNCTSLAIPKLFPKIGKPEALIHKLDTTPVNSTKVPRWDCFWYQELGQGTLGGSAHYLEPMETAYKVFRGMRIDTYC